MRIPAFRFHSRYLPPTGLSSKGDSYLNWKTRPSTCSSDPGMATGFEDEDKAYARRVVLAVGLTHFEYVPPMLGALPETLVTHSSRHHELEQFKGREVAVVGGGASALDLAALLHQGGAQVQVIARKPVIRFHDPPQQQEPSFLDRLPTPITGIGPGWKLFLCTNAPLLFRQMPQEFRFDKVRGFWVPHPVGSPRNR